MSLITIETAFSVGSKKKRNYQVNLKTEDITDIAAKSGLTAANQAIDKFFAQYVSNLKPILAETINSADKPEVVA
jgi:hypothetical protein